MSVCFKYFIKIQRKLKKILLNYLSKHISWNDFYTLGENTQPCQLTELYSFPRSIGFLFITKNTPTFIFGFRGTLNFAPSFIP